MHTPHDQVCYAVVVLKVSRLVFAESGTQTVVEREGE